MSVKVFEVLFAVSLALIAWPLSVAMPSHSHAAQVSVVAKPNCYALLDGPIEEGDSRKVHSIFNGAQTSDHMWDLVRAGETRAALCLNSASGSYREAFQIMQVLTGQKTGSLDFDLSIGTVVDAGMTCKTVCAIAFLGGSYNVGESFFSEYRMLHEDGLLDFGLPSLSSGSDTGVSAEDIEQAYTEAIESIAALFALELENASMGFVPYDVMSEVLSSDPGSPFVITLKNKLEDMKIIYIRRNGSCWMSLWKPELERFEYGESISCDIYE